MTPEDDYAYRKAQRQMGQGGVYVMVAMIVVSLSVITWLGKRTDEWLKNQQPPGDPQPAQAEAK